jgi:hypothetical protein
MSIVIKADEDSDLLHRYLSCIDQKITLVDTQGIEDTAFRGRGTWTGTISQASRAGNRITFSVDSLLSKLNVNKTAKPYFGRSRDSTITTYIVNQATNPSSEVSATTNYSVQAGTGGTAAITQGATGAYAGTKTTKLTWSVAATGVGGLIYLHTGILTGGFYTFSMQAKSNTDQAMQMSIQWLNAASAAVGSPVLIGGVTLPSGVWQEFDAVGLTAPATATQAQVRMFNYTIGSGFHQWAIGNILETDGVMITQGTVMYPYGDGNGTNNFWNGTPDASSSTIAITIAQPTGYDATFGNAFRYYASLASVPATAISIDPALEDVFVSYRSWEGNLLDHLKMMCSAEGAIFFIVNEVIQVQKPRKNVIRIENTDTISQTVTAQGSVREVLVNNYNNQWLTDSVTAAPDNVYSITVAASNNFSLSTDDSLVSVNNPICVAAIAPLPYTSGTGQYVITDSKNNAVNPADWTAAGGSLSVMLDPNNNNNILVSVHAPNVIPNYEAPFRMAMDVADTDVPALYITGSGVFSRKEVVSIVTGTSVNTQTQDQSPVVDNPFLGDITHAHDRGTFSADERGGVSVSGSGTFPFDPDSGGQEFGNIAGSRFYAGAGIYLITDATIARKGISMNYVMDVSFDDLTNLFAMIFNEFNATYAGLTFTSFNSTYPTQTMDQFNAVSNNPTMTTFNTVYAGSNFNDHAVYPYLKGAPVENVEARF